MTPPTTGRSAGEPPRQRTHVLSLVGVVLLTLIAFSAFFVGFLLAPLAVLLFFSLIFYTRNRSEASKGEQTAEAEPGGGARGRLIAEARARQAALTLEEQRNRAYEDVGQEDADREHAADPDDAGSLVPEAVSREQD
jgi:hypothetical protein